MLKKEPAVNLSRNYPNIWRKLYRNEFHNLRSIKKKTFAALTKYIKVNELIINNNTEDILMANDITIADLNFLEKSILADRSKKLSITNNNSNKNQEIFKNNTVKSEYDNKIKKIYTEVSKANLNTKIKNNAGCKRSSTSNINKIQILNHENIVQSNINDKSSLKMIFM